MNITKSDPVRWVGQDHRTGLPQKRKQAIKACAKCRKSKKRCSHLPISAAEGLESLPDTSARAPPRVSSSTQRASRLSTEAPTSASSRHGSPVRGLPPSDPDASNAASQLLQIHDRARDLGPLPESSDSGDKATHFIGELNPEGIFIEATLARSARAAIISPDKEVTMSPGIWIDGGSRPTSPRVRRIPNSGTSSRPKDAPATFSSKELTVTADDLDSFSTLAQQFIVAERGALIQGTDPTWDAMKRIYLDKISPILPFFDDSILAGPRTNSLIRRLIEAAVCLAASADPEAEPHLILHKKRPSSSVTGSESARQSKRVSYQEYSQAVVEFIRVGVVELRKDEPQEHILDCISVMALTCLFWQPGPQARFSPMDFFAMLASMVHTYGIHLLGTAEGPAPFKKNDRKRPNRLFRCLYAIDRLLSSFHARPVLFHNYDILISLKPHEGDTPSFKLFMALITNLDQVIELYRPRPTITQSDIDFPVFERLIMENGAGNEPDHILGTLEVLYHAISILSVRMPRDRFRSAPEDDEVRGCISYSHLPPNKANARRSLSADRIVETIRDYKLSPMPFIPYALALSLSVQYRKWRFSRTPMFRIRAKKAFEKILPIMKGLGKVWTSARVSSTLGYEVFKKLTLCKPGPLKGYPKGYKFKTKNQEEMDVDPEPSAADKNMEARGSTSNTETQRAVQVSKSSDQTSEPADLPTPAMSSKSATQGVTADSPPTYTRPPHTPVDIMNPVEPPSSPVARPPMTNSDHSNINLTADQTELPTSTNLDPTQSPDDFQNDFSPADLGRLDEQVLAGFDWTLANTLDPGYYASSYYWPQFQGAETGTMMDDPSYSSFFPGVMSGYGFGMNNGGGMMGGMDEGTGAGAGTGGGYDGQGV